MRKSSEIEIVNGCIKNEDKYMHELYTLYSERLFGMCKRYSIENADDIFQESFYKIYKNIHKFNFKSTLGTWLNSIVINTAIDFLKQNQKENKFFVYINDNNLSAGENQYHFSKTEENEMAEELADLEIEKIVELINELAETQKIVFNLSTIENLTHKEISSLLEISEQNSRKILQRAKENLKNKLLNNKLTLINNGK